MNAILSATTQLHISGNLPNFPHARNPRISTTSKRQFTSILSHGSHTKQASNKLEEKKWTGNTSEKKQAT